MTTTTFRIAKLHCEACIKFCTLKFKKLPGVTDVSIDLVSGEATVTAEGALTLEQLQAALGGKEFYDILPAAPETSSVVEEKAA